MPFISHRTENSVCILCCYFVFWYTLRPPYRTATYCSMWYRLRCFLSNDSAYFILHFWYDLLDMLVLFIYRFNVEHFFYMLKSPSGGACFYSWLRNWISINLLPFKWFQWIFKSALFNWMVKKIYWKKTRNWQIRKLNLISHGVPEKILYLAQPIFWTLQNIFRFRVYLHTLNYVWISILFMDWI